MRILIILSILLITSKFVFATQQDKRDDSLLNGKVIYGNDDRLDLYQVTDKKIKQIADSTVALIESSNIKNNGSGFSEIIADSFEKSYNLCASEPFKEQSNGAFCSGFLVAPNIIVTAGHCIRTQKNCESTKFVFGYALKSQTHIPEIISSEDVFSCSQLLHSEVNGNGSDFAVIKLDRDVVNHSPLKIRSSGQINVGESLTEIGHPAGLPSKIAGGASVRSQENGYFIANLDTYGGNSGSAVFNNSTLEVEGVLVRGATDFIFKDGCRVSNICKDNECRGEDVTRITNALKYIP